MSELIQFARQGDDVEPDSHQGQAIEFRRRATMFVCTTEADYLEGTEVLQLIKKKRRQRKEEWQQPIADAKRTYDSVRASFNKIDDELEAAYEIIRASCESWIDARREVQKAHLVAASQALTPSPERVAQQASAAFDAAIESGDTAKAERIVAGGWDFGVDDLPVLDATALMVPETTIPKVPGVSVAVPHTWELLDESRIPREYMTVDRKKITKLVKAVGPEAQKILGPGVLVRPDTTLRIREKP